MCWQGHLRWRAENECSDLTVVCEPGHELLYQDFAKKIVNTRPGVISDQRDCWANRITTEGAALQHSDYTPTNFTKVWAPSRLKISHMPRSSGYQYFQAQTFRKFQLAFPAAQPLVLAHIRNTTKCGTSVRNYTRFAEVLNAMPSHTKVATIGTKDQAQHHVGAIDARANCLQSQAERCGEAWCMVGPSSGPMVFAMHCGCPVVTWGPEVLAHRYTDTWNPFKTPAEFIVANDWQPNPKLVVERIKTFL